MAKRKRKSKSGGVKTRTRVVTKTRRVYVSAKKKARRARAALGTNVSKGDIILAVGGAGVGSIGGSIILSKMPASIPDVAKNGVLAALGGFVAYKGLKKRNKLMLGLGLGAGAAAATNLIGSMISGGSATLSGCRRTMGAPYRTLGAPYRTLGAVPNASLAGSFHALAAPVDGEEM